MGSRAGQESQGPARVRKRIETGIFRPRACYHDRKSVSAESPKGSWFISPACVRSLSLPLGVGEALQHHHRSASFDSVPEMGEGSPAGFATGAQGGSAMV